jgi:hypothetical protein
MPAIEAPPDQLLSVLHQASVAIAALGEPNGPLRLFVDDAHLLDDGSATLVHQLVKERTCSVVVTIRTHPCRS